jgi:hypothetical protein
MKILLALLFGYTAWASVGSITQTAQQTAVIIRQQKSLPGVQGTGVEMKDLIKTGTGRVSITFADNTRMQVTEHSRLVVDEFVYDPARKGSGKLALKVALGTVRYASGAIAKNNPASVNVRTPTATVGVRGTDFMSVVDELGRSTVVLLPVCPPGWANLEQDCKTGAITVSTEAASVFMNRPFQATFVANSDAAPSNPVVLNISEDAIKNLLIQSQPAEIKSAQRVAEANNELDSDVLNANFLANQLDQQDPAQDLNTDLLPNLLDQDFVSNIVQKVQKTISAQPKISAQATVAPPVITIVEVREVKSGLDVPSEIDEPESDKENAKKITSRDTDNNQAQVLRDGVSESRITLIQSQLEIVNTINFGGNTVIIIRQK